MEEFEQQPKSEWTVSESEYHPADERTGALVSEVDIMPTILDAVGVGGPPMAGHSLRAIVQGRVPPGWRRKLFAEYTSHAPQHFYPRRSLREGSFKIIHNLDFRRPNPVPNRGTGHIAQLEDPALKAAFGTDAHPPEWELYNLEKDPFETMNLAENPEYAAELRRMQGALGRSREQFHDPLLDPAEYMRLEKLHGF